MRRVRGKNFFFYVLFLFYFILFIYTLYCEIVLMFGLDDPIKKIFLKKIKIKIK